MPERQYTQREWRFLSWWLATYHPHADVALNARLGPTAIVGNDSDAAGTLGSAARVRNRYADAVMIEGGDPYLIEAKLEPDPGIFSTLIHYARKFRADPLWITYKARTLHLVALVYHDDPSVAIEAPFYGVQWISWQPNLAELPPCCNAFQALDTESSPLMLPSQWPTRLASWGIKALSG